MPTSATQAITPCELTFRCAGRAQLTEAIRLFFGRIHGDPIDVYRDSTAYYLADSRDAEHFFPDADWQTEPLPLVSDPGDLSVNVWGWLKGLSPDDIHRLTGSHLSDGDPSDLGYEIATQQTPDGQHFMLVIRPAWAVF